MIFEKWTDEQTLRIIFGTNSRFFISSWLRNFPPDKHTKHAINKWHWYIPVNTYHRVYLYTEKCNFAPCTYFTKKKHISFAKMIRLTRYSRVRKQTYKTFECIMINQPCKNNTRHEKLLDNRPEGINFTLAKRNSLSMRQLLFYRPGTMAELLKKILPDSIRQIFMLEPDSCRRESIATMSLVRYWIRL